MVRGVSRTDVYEYRSHCPKCGHIFDEANTGVSSGGSPICRRCERERVKRYAQPPAAARTVDLGK